MTNITLEKKVALVTGASSGIGQTTVIALAKAGVSVMAVARREDRLNALVSGLKREGGRVAAWVADVSQEEQCHRMVSETVKAFGRLDILVNNAGVMLNAPISESNTADWVEMVNTNLLGAMYLTQAALPALKKTKAGDIVNISSVAGRIARKAAGGYNATKFGLNAFSEALRQELSDQHVRVTVIEPGLVATELMEHVPHAETLAAYRTFAESMTRLTADDVTQAIMFALSQPRHVNFREILMAPTEQVYP